MADRACADRVRPGGAVGRPRAGTVECGTVAQLVAVAAAAVRMARSRGRLGVADAWAESGIGPAVDALTATENQGENIHCSIPAGAVATVEASPAVALRHAWRCGNRLAAAEALAAMFDGADTPLGRLDAADRALAALTPPTGPWGPR